MREAGVSSFPVSTLYQKKLFRVSANSISVSCWLGYKPVGKLIDVEKPISQKTSKYIKQRAKNFYPLNFNAI